MDWLTPQIFVMTIVGILGTQVGLFLAMMKLQERNTDSQIDAVKKQLENSQSNTIARIEALKQQIESTKSINIENHAEESVDIKIYQPPEWAHGKPKRKKHTRYSIGPITGVVSNNVKSAFLAIRNKKNGDLRIIKRLKIGKDGVWTDSIEIPSWDNSKYYEIVGAAFSKNIPLTDEYRITEETDPTLSNHVPVYLTYEDNNS